MSHASIFSLSFFFFGRTKNLGICEATKDGSGASYKNRERRLHLEEPLDWDKIGLQMRPTKDAGPELRHSKSDLICRVGAKDANVSHMNEAAFFFLCEATDSVKL